MDSSDLQEIFFVLADFSQHLLPSSFFVFLRTLVLDATGKLGAHSGDDTIAGVENIFPMVEVFLDNILRTGNFFVSEASMSDSRLLATERRSFGTFHISGLDAKDAEISRTFGVSARGRWYGPEPRDNVSKYVFFFHSLRSSFSSLFCKRSRASAFAGSRFSPFEDAEYSTSASFFGGYLEGEDMMRQGSVI